MRYTMILFAWYFIALNSARFQEIGPFVSEDSCTTASQKVDKVMYIAATPCYER